MLNQKGVAVTERGARNQGSLVWNSKVPIWLRSFLTSSSPHLDFHDTPLYSSTKLALCFPWYLSALPYMKVVHYQLFFFSLPTPRWKKGSCKLGRVCTFAHGETELTAWNNHLEKMDSELKTKKVEQKDVDSVEESKVSSLVEVEQLTPTYRVIAITTSINRCNI